MINIVQDIAALSITGATVTPITLDLQLIIPRPIVGGGGSNNEIWYPNEIRIQNKAGIDLWWNAFEYDDWINYQKYLTGLPATPDYYHFLPLDIGDIVSKTNASKYYKFQLLNSGAGAASGIVRVVAANYQFIKLQ